MTDAEERQARRDAAIRRSHRIDRLDFNQLLNFIHRLAAIVPSDVDRVLAEFDANTPKPRAEKQLHPVTFYGNDIHGNDTGGGLSAYCRLCAAWHVHIEDGHGLAQLERLVREHSGIET